MSIENDLKRLADAAEGILAHLSGQETQKRGPGRPRKTETVDAAPAGEAQKAEEKPAPAATKAEAATTPVDGPTLDEVKARAKAIVALAKREPLLALFKKHGGETPSTLPAENYAAFMADSEALL